MKTFNYGFLIFSVLFACTSFADDKTAVSQEDIFTQIQKQFNSVLFKKEIVFERAAFTDAYDDARPASKFFVNGTIYSVALKQSREESIFGVFSRISIPFHVMSGSRIPICTMTLNDKDPNKQYTVSAGRTLSIVGSDTLNLSEEEAIAIENTSGQSVLKPTTNSEGGAELLTIFLGKPESENKSIALLCFVANFNKKELSPIESYTDIQAALGGYAALAETSEEL